METLKRRNKVGAVCACGKFINAIDHDELVQRLHKHFRNCPSQERDTGLMKLNKLPHNFSEPEVQTPT